MKFTIIASQVLATLAFTLEKRMGQARNVTSKHEAIPNGVRFNVETVVPNNKRLRVMGSSQDVSKSFAIEYYTSDAEYFERNKLNAKLQRSQELIEASSFSYKPFVDLRGLYGDDNTENARERGLGGFSNAVGLAFARHYPLVIRPDDIWLLITYAFGKFVNENANALRSLLVDHEGLRLSNSRPN